MRRLLPFALLLLAGCQTSNPYQGTVAVPPGPATAPSAANLAAYPPAPTDFTRYRSWSWRALPVGSLTLGPELIGHVLAGELDQRGLRPAGAEARGDLRIDLVVSQRTRLRESGYAVDPYLGYYPGHRPYGYGAYGHAPRRTYREEVVRVDLRLYDGESDRLLWESHAEAPRDGRDDEAALRAALGEALQDYPPG